MGKQSRRQFLALAGAATSGVAGCLDFGLFNSFSAKYDEWLPRPDALPYTDRYAIRSFSPAAITDATVLSPAVDQRLNDYTGAARAVVDVSPESVESLFKLGYFATVLTGEFDPRRVASSVTDRGWVSLSPHAGFDRYRSADSSTALGVTAQALVISPGVSGTEQSFLDPVLEAKDGNVDRYLAGDTTLKSLADALGNGDVIVARDDVQNPRIDGIRATGIAWRFTNDMAKTTLGLAFYSDAEVNISAVERLTKTNAFADFRKVNHGRRGRVAIVTAQVPTVTSTAMAPIPSIDAAMGTVPNASFNFTLSADETTLHVTHDGGEPIPHSRLNIEGSGFESVPGVDQTEPGRWQGETSYDGTVVTGGDKVLVGVGSDARIEVVYDPIAESSPITMATWPS